MGKGVLIVFEGIDGSGKRTLVNLLANTLQEKGVGNVVYSYPDYGSEYGKIIKMFLDEKIELNVTAQFLLYLLDIVKDKEKVVADLNRGLVVIMDRYFPATIAYQCTGGFNYEVAKQMVKLVELPVPNLLFYIEVPIKVSFARKKAQKGTMDRFEKDRLFQGQVAENYLRLCEENFPAKWVKFDGIERPEKLAKKLYATVTNLLKRGGETVT
jgi:dTMP kinase